MQNGAGRHSSVGRACVASARTEEELAPCPPAVPAIPPTSDRLSSDIRGAFLLGFHPISLPRKHHPNTPKWKEKFKLILVKDSLLSEE